VQRARVALLCNPRMLWRHRQLHCRADFLGLDMAFSKVAASLFAAGLMFSANSVDAATLFSADLNAPGDGLLTVDTATSLQWLDLTATVGQPRANVLAGSYVTAQGFRYATANEVTKLWEDGGAVGPFVVYGDDVNPLDLTPASLMINLMGCTSAFGPAHNPCVGPIPGVGDVQNFNLGFFGTDPYDAAGVIMFFGATDPRRFGATFRINYGQDDAYELLGRHDVGSYLVRAIPVSPVPEPRVWAMLVLGFGATGVAMRRQRRRGIFAFPAG